MMFRRLPVLAAALLLLAPAIRPALAQSSIYEVGGVDMRLLPPTGYVALDPGTPLAEVFERRAAASALDLIVAFVPPGDQRGEVASPLPETFFLVGINPDLEWPVSPETFALYQSRLERVLAAYERSYGPAMPDYGPRLADYRLWRLESGPAFTTDIGWARTTAAEGGRTEIAGTSRALVKGRIIFMLFEANGGAVTGEGFALGLANLISWSAAAVAFNPAD